jgi:endoglucanase
MRKVALLLAVVAACVMLSPAQNATPPGVLVKWTASVAGTNPIAGYNVYIAPGSLTTATWPANPTPVNGATVIAGTSYSIPAASFTTLGETWSIGVQAQDTAGIVSAFTIVTVAVPSSFPSGPSAPGSATVTVQ